MENIKTRTQYLGLFTSRTEAMDFEATVLSIGEEFLPACAQAVLEDRTVEPPAEYWQFLASQLEADNQRAQETDA